MREFLKRLLHFGAYRVVYKEGEWSEPMPYREAMDYAKIFHGVVIETDDEIRWRPGR